MKTIYTDSYFYWGPSQPPVPQAHIEDGQEDKQVPHNPKKYTYFNQPANKEQPEDSVGSQEYENKHNIYPANHYEDIAIIKVIREHLLSRQVRHQVVKASVQLKQTNSCLKHLN